MRAMRNSNPRIREIHADVENDEILRWVSTLQPARVTRSAVTALSSLLLQLPIA